MDGMFGLQSPPDYVDRPVMPPDGLFDCSYSYHGMIPSPAGDRIPMLGSDDLTDAAGSFHCSVGSEAGSVTPDAHLRGGERLDDAAASWDDLGYDNDGISLIKAQIAAHPSYPKLLEAYIDCQKVGAPPEVAKLLDEIGLKNGLLKHDGRVPACAGDDIELDIFMETYCDILVKYKSDLSRPFHEATNFLNNIESQLSNICKAQPPSTRPAIVAAACSTPAATLQRFSHRRSSAKDDLCCNFPVNSSQD
ncbi:unnamed protein product [Cuscuta epithymum]|uniref:Homeobox protein knotted-1-like 6 n=1 Tax=Cuscuta epithymum TaxID=186058 RepID=A0AAV0DRV2_9ASTE|nr:unnamed protein product [Cuscuta epithymum]